MKDTDGDRGRASMAEVQACEAHTLADLDALLAECRARVDALLAGCRRARRIHSPT